MIGNGVVSVDPGSAGGNRGLYRPCLRLEPAGFHRNAHLIMPYVLVEWPRNSLGKPSSIGTTCRGIGPAYADKAYRIDPGPGPKTRRSSASSDRRPPLIPRRSRSWRSGGRKVGTRRPSRREIQTMTGSNSNTVTEATA